MEVLRAQTVETTTAEILAQIRNRLAEEDARLPPSALAGGQYLNNPHYVQRGLYGTAAAILVLARQGAQDAAALADLGRLNYYVANTLAVERASVSPTDFTTFVERRVILQSTDVFRLADVGFALSYASPAAAHKVAALQMVTHNLERSRRGNGGYAIAEEATDINILATAHAVRCLAANNLPVRQGDWRELTDYMRAGVDPYIRSFVIYVVAMFRKDFHSVARNAWRATYQELRGQFHASHAEANYEYTRPGMQDYVRLPWQIYLVQACARLFPMSRFIAFDIQRKLTSICGGVLSPEGFRYLDQGPYLSTRTYATIFEMLCEINDHNLTQPLPSIVLRSAGDATRILASRAMNIVLYLLMAAIAIVSVFLWVRSPDFRFVDVAPNFAAEAVVVLLVVASARIRRQR